MRRVPNWLTHFDDAEGIQVAAFIPRPIDEGGLSAHLEALAAADSILRFMERSPALRDFGLCRINVARLAEETDGAAWVEYFPTEGALGEAHVRIHNCADEIFQTTLTRLAEVVRRPRNLR